MEHYLSFAENAVTQSSSGVVRGQQDIEGFRDQIFRLAYSLTLNYNVAEDIAQDCLIRIWRNRDAVQQAQSPAAYVAKITINRTRTYLKRTRTWVPLFKIEMSAPDADPRMLELNVAVQKLPKELREVLLMTSVYGASYEEAAKLLCLPVGTIGSRLNRAKQLLAEAMGAE